MNSFLPTLVTWLQQYGYPALWLCACISAFGLPLPTVLLLLAAGAFAALGDFNIVVLALVAISASVCGDSLGYLLGRRLGSRLFDWLEHQRRFRFISPQKIAQSQAYFNRRGAWAIFLSRFLFLVFGGIINLLSGTERYPYRRFLLYDFSGQVLGALLPLLLGYFFGESWEMVGDIIGAVSGLIVGLLLVVVLLVRLIKVMRNAQAQKNISTASQKALDEQISVEVELSPSDSRGGTSP